MDNTIQASLYGARLPAVETWHDRAAGQELVVQRSQLIGWGMTAGQVDAQCDARRWRKLTEDLLVLHNGPLTGKQQWWAATMAVGPLAGRTALEAHGLTGWPGTGVEVVTARGRRPPLPLDVPITVHESRRFSLDDVVWRNGLPLLGVERSAVDAAAWTNQPRAACGLLVAVVQQRRSNARRLSRALSLAGRVRHVRLLRVVLNDIEGGAQAMSEVDLAGICRRYGLLPPERQVVRIDGSGKRRYVDARVSAPNGRSVLVEIDGALHLLVKTYWDDMSRANELVISGDRLLRFPSIALLLDETTVGNQLRRACGLDPLTVRAV